MRGAAFRPPTTHDFFFSFINTAFICASSAVKPAAVVSISFSQSVARSIKSLPPADRKFNRLRPRRFSETSEVLSYFAFILTERVNGYIRRLAALVKPYLFKYNNPDSQSSSTHIAASIPH